jgi:hypothetical protein
LKSKVQTLKNSIDTTNISLTLVILFFSLPKV